MASLSRAGSIGPWHEEALERLEEEAKKQLQSEKPLRLPKPPVISWGILVTPVSFKILEQYITIAENEWLLKAIENPASDAGQAVRELADLLQEQHSDSWLKQFAHATGKDACPDYKAHAAFAHNKDDEHQLARDESLAAAEDFSRKKNFPGLVRQV